MNKRKRVAQHKHRAKRIKLEARRKAAAPAAPSRVVARIAPPAESRAPEAARPDGEAAAAAPRRPVRRRATAPDPPVP